MENYYQILNVDKNATQKQIKQAYINLLKMYHPDVYQGDKEFAEKKTAEITMAYGVLRNYLQRKNYDEKLAKENAYEQKQTEKKYPFNSANKASEQYKDKQEKQKEQEFAQKEKVKKPSKIKTFFSNLFKSKKDKKSDVAKPYKKKQPKKVEKVNVNDKNVKVKNSKGRSLTKEEQKEKQAFDLSIAVFVAILFLVIVLTIVLK